MEKPSDKIQIDLNYAEDSRSNSGLSPITLSPITLETSRMSILHTIGILALSTLLTACGSNGLDELKRLCEKDAGLTINKTVEADGYYDATRKGGALWVLIPSKYDFTEFCNFDTNKPSFNEAGCWRLTKVSRKTNQCNETINKALANSGSDSSRGFREKNCISVEKIAKPTARYSYHSNFKKWYSKNGVSKFTRSDVFIQSDLTKELLGQYISYSYNIKPSHSTAKSCETFEGDYPSFKESNLINTVIQPIKE